MAAYTGNTAAGTSGLQIKLKGFDELARQLRALPEKIAQKELTAALREAAKPTLDEARKLAPVAAQRTRWVNPGLLRRSIIIKNFKVRGLGPFSRGVSVGVRKLSLKKRRGQKIARRLTKLAKGTSLGASYNDPYYWYFIERGTAHMAARPFLRPAFNKHQSQFLESLREKLKARIEAIWRAQR